MNYFELKLNNDNNSHKLLKEIYDNISDDIIKKDGIISNDSYIFNNFIGDITKNIKWTWAINKQSLSLFENIIDIYILDINNYFKNNFKIIGGSFITLYDDNVSESDFHLDINSNYDSKTSSNVLTIIFPLYINDNMGNLQYYDSNNLINTYKYNIDKAIIWDACKFNHRTEPYQLSKKEKRVLVSMNLASNKQWAIQTTINTLKYQGNIIKNIVYKKG